MNDFLANDGDEYMTRMVIDIASRSFRVYSNEGDMKTIECESMEEFMGVLEFVRDFQETGLLDEDTVVYSEPSTV